MTRTRRSLSALAVLVAGLVMIAAWVLMPSPSQAQSDQSALAGLISRLLSTPTTRVSIGGIDGALSSNAVIRDVQISDERGVWLSLDRAELIWSRTALLRGRLQVDKLTLGRLELARLPQSSETDAAQVSDAPILPELPVEVRVDQFALAELVLGEPILGTAARVTANGSARIGDPDEGLRLRLDARRLDAPGTVAINLDYVPETNRLALNLVHDEPAGGIAARLLNLPNLPPVQLRVAGDGPLSAFAARLDFQAGPTIGAEGTANVNRTGDAYALGLALAAQIEGLLPPAVAPIFQGTTRLDGNATIADSGAVQLSQLRLASSVAAVELNGTMSPDQILDVRLTGRALPTDGSTTRAGGVELGRLALDLTAQGPLTAPQLNGTVSAGAVKLAQGSLDSLEARIDSAPIAGPNPPERFSFAITADARGLRLTDRALDRAVGNTISVVARGEVSTEGIADVAEASITTPTASASFTGRVGGSVLDGTLAARIGSLAPFSGLANVDLRGAARLNAKLTGNPGKQDITAVLDGRLTGFSSGNAAISGALGETVTLSGTARRIPGGFGLENFRIDGGNVDVTASGQATERAADLGLRISVDDLGRLDKRISAGRAAIDARLTGSLETPDVAATVTVTDMRAMDRAIPRLVVRLDAKDVTGALRANVALDGTVSGKAASGSAELLRLAAGGYALNGLDFTIGSVALKGDVTLDDQNLAAGNVSLVAGNLDDLSALVLTELRGQVEARIGLEVRDGGQFASVEGRGSKLRFGEIALDSFTENVTVSDLYRRPIVDGTLEANTLTVAGQTFRQIRIVADGSADATAFEVSANALGFDLALTGRLVPTDTAIRIDLATFLAQRGGRRIALADPASVTLAGGTATISDLTLVANGGRLTIAGRAGETFDLSVDIRALPLSIAEIFAPNLGLQGTLSGEARITGSQAAPAGTYRLQVSGLSLPALRNAGVSALGIRAEGRLADGRVTTEATVDAGRIGTIRVTGSAPIDPAGDLDLRTTGRIDLSAANAFLAAGGRRVTGAANLDLRIAGPLSAPRVEGSATIANASFTDELQGIRLTGIEARIAAQGDTVRIERLSARTPNGGTLGASGTVRIDPAAGFPADIRITGNRAQLVSNDIFTAVANLDLSVTGPVTQSPRLAGRVSIVTLDVTVPDRLPTTLRPLPGTKHVNPPPTAAARLAIRRERERNAGRGGRAFNASLDLTLVAQNRIFVRGRGINAELGGDLRLTGTSNDPVAIGAFELRRGRLDILGQRIDFTRGRLDFTGDLTPSLDFVAETQAGDVTARIAVSGPANSPDFAISSTPDLPQDEVLSRILFDKASGGLSAGQALQLAQAVASFSGGGDGAFEQLRRSLGVDSLDITAGSGGGVGVGVSRYISDNVRVGVRAGARPEDSGLSVDIDLSRRLKLQGEVGAGGGTSVGIGYEYEY